MASRRRYDDMMWDDSWEGEDPNDLPTGGQNDLPPGGQISSGPVDTAPFNPPVNPPEPSYTPIPGYDFGKLSDPTHVGEGKYNPDAKLFSQALSATGAKPGQAGLQAVYDWMKGKGSNVEWGGKDTFKFGPNEVDVMGNYNPSGEGSSWAFQDPRGRAPASTPPPLPTPGGVGGGAGTQTPSGSSNGSPNGSPYTLEIPELPDFSTYLGVGPSTPAGTGETDWQNKGAQDLFTSSMNSINNPMGSAQFESLRQPIDKARRTATNQAQAALADRGTLMGGGDIGNVIGRIEERLAPDFASAVQRAGVENVGQARGSAFSALQGGNQYKAIIGDLALRQLDQNRQWNQFLADFGLRREQVQELLSQGRVDQLLKYYDIWNQAAQTSANGRI